MTPSPPQIWISGAALRKYKEFVQTFTPEQQSREPIFTDNQLVKMKLEGKMETDERVTAPLNLYIEGIDKDDRYYFYRIVSQDNRKDNEFPHGVKYTCRTDVPLRIWSPAAGITLPATSTATTGVTPPATYTATTGALPPQQTWGEAAAAA